MIQLLTRFGKLTVVDRFSNKKLQCECDCGSHIVVKENDLLRGHNKSCGCGKYDGIRLEKGDASCNQVILDYKRKADQRGLEFNLTREECKELFESDCYYCGESPSNIKKSGLRNGSYTYNGIDRIDNNKGYIIDNVVSCCKKCNWAKAQLSVQEFIDLCTKVYNKHGGKEHVQNKK